MRTDLIVGKILKVNHCGEYAAIRIYKAQIAWCRWYNPALVPVLTQFLSDEISHLNEFDRLRVARNTRTCHFLPLWGLGGYMLGFITGMMGIKGIMVCTEAVEETVDLHLAEQLHYLEQEDIDPEVKQSIIDIQVEEREHLNYAKQFTRDDLISRFIRKVIVLSTQIAIHISVRL